MTKVNKDESKIGGTLSIETKIVDKEIILVIFRYFLRVFLLTILPFLKFFRTRTKLIAYQGLLLKKLSMIGNLNKRADCMTLTLFNQKIKYDFTKHETDSNKRKLEKDLLKIKVLIVLSLY